MSSCLASSSSGDIAKSQEKTKHVSHLLSICQKPVVLRYRNVDGIAISLSIITHQPFLCQEFIVTSPEFDYCRWLTWTVILYAVAWALQLHMQDVHFLTGLLVLLILLLLVKLNFKVQKESLLVTASVGVQVTTIFASGRKKATFYDMSDIAGVVINEAVTMHKVVYYLTLLLGRLPPTNLRLVPLLTHTWPSLSCLTCIHRHLNDLLLMPNNELEPENQPC